MTSEVTAVSAHTVSHGDAFIARRLVQVNAAAREDVDDITQEVLCALAFRRGPIPAPGGRTPAQVREAFLWRAALWQLDEHGRRKAQLRAGDGLGAEVSPRATPSAEALSLAFAPIATLRRALAKLEETAPALYAVLDLAADGVPTRAAAAALEIPEGTVSSRLRRARATVRAFFEAEEAKGARRSTPATPATPARGRHRWRELFEDQDERDGDAPEQDDGDEVSTVRPRADEAPDDTDPPPAA